MTSAAQTSSNQCGVSRARQGVIESLLQSHPVEPARDLELEHVSNSMTCSRPLPAATYFPASPFDHPDEVLADQHLTKAQKRAILASWLSDARTVENAPSLRRLDNGAIVDVDDTMRALQSLDMEADRTRPPVKELRPFARRKGNLPHWLHRAVRLKSSDDEDDPPPSPALIAMPPKRPRVDIDAPDLALPPLRMAVGA